MDPYGGLSSRISKKKGRKSRNKRGRQDDYPSIDDSKAVAAPTAASPRRIMSAKNRQHARFQQAHVHRQATEDRFRPSDAYLSSHVDQSDAGPPVASTSRLAPISNLPTYPPKPKQSAGVDSTDEDNDEDVRRSLLPSASSSDQTPSHARVAPSKAIPITHSMRALPGPSALSSKAIPDARAEDVEMVYESSVSAVSSASSESAPDQEDQEVPLNDEHSNDDSEHDEDPDSSHWTSKGANPYTSDDDMFIYDAIDGTPYRQSRAANGEEPPRFQEIIDLVDSSDGESYIYASSSAEDDEDDDEEEDDMIILDKPLWKKGKEDAGNHLDQDAVARMRASVLAHRQRKAESQALDAATHSTSTSTSDSPSVRQGRSRVLSASSASRKLRLAANLVSSRAHHQSLPPRPSVGVDPSTSTNKQSEHNVEADGADSSAHASSMQLEGSSSPPSLPLKPPKSSVAASGEDVRTVLVSRSQPLGSTDALKSAFVAESASHPEPSTSKGVYVRPANAKPPSISNPRGVDVPRLLSAKKQMRKRGADRLGGIGFAVRPPPRLGLSEFDRRISAHHRLRELFPSEIGPSIENSLFEPAAHIVPSKVTLSLHPPDEHIPAGFWPGPYKLANTHLAYSPLQPSIPNAAGGSTSRPRIDIFIDNSNIRNCFTSWLADCFPQPLRADGVKDRSDIVAGQRYELDYGLLFALLERGNGSRVGKRILVGSSKLKQDVCEAIKWGYEVSILQRINRKSYGVASNPHPIQANPSNPSLPVRPGSGSTSAVIPTGPRDAFIFSQHEQCVDELLHLKILESLLDYSVPPSSTTRPLIVLVSGDAQSSEFNPDGFLGCVKRALVRGWDVEIWAFQKNSSKLWTELRDECRRNGKIGEVKIIDLTEFGQELIRARVVGGVGGAKI